jgi:hypothetical protein
MIQYGISIIESEGKEPYQFHKLESENAYKWTKTRLSNILLIKLSMPLNNA